MADRDYTIQHPDGREITITGPDNATPDQLRAAAQSAFSQPPVSAGDGQPSMLSKVGQQIGNLAAGAVRGAGSIGATLLMSPQDLHDSLFGKSKTLSGVITGQEQLNPNEQRRKAMDDALQTMGAQPDSLAYKGGKLAGEVAGTAGAGGALAGILKGVAPSVAAAAPNALTALQSAGMSAGTATGIANPLLRVLGGAASGGVTAGLVDPSEAKTGAVVGGLIPPAVQAAGWAGQKIGSGVSTLLKNALGMSSGVGAEPISQAFKAGATGSKDFLDNMAGNVPLTDVLDKAKQGLQAMSAAKSAEYRSGMIPVANDKTVLAFTDIDKALQDASSVGSYKGQVKNDAANAAVSKMQEIVDQWKNLAPNEFHTPEGLDALKQKLGGILESIPYQEKTARLAAGKVYNATKDSITTQAPVYAGVMKDYGEASQQINEIERALSLGDKASKDTAMRKLQSLMRNNVQTNYGNRLNLANALEDKGGVELLPSLAGQAMNSWTPRSLAGQLGGGATALGAMFAHNPYALAVLPFQSPRVVGSMAYGAGRLAGAAGGAAAGTQQAISNNALMQLLGPEGLTQLGYRAAPVLATAP